MIALFILKVILSLGGLLYCFFLFFKGLVKKENRLIRKAIYSFLALVAIYVVIFILEFAIIALAME